MPCARSSPAGRCCCPPRPGVDDLGGVDLGEALGGEVLPEGRLIPSCTLKTERVRRLRSTRGLRDSSVSRFSLSRRLETATGMGAAGRDSTRTSSAASSRAPGGPFLPPHRPGDHRGTLLTQPLRQLLRPAHALDRPVPHPQGKEGDPAHGPQAVDRPLQGDGPARPALLPRFPRTPGGRALFP